VVLAATLHAIPAIPAIGRVLVLSVDWFMGIARALGNLIGNCVATVAIAAWEGDIDRERAHAVLDGTYSPDDEPLAEPGGDIGTAATASGAH
jgi:aerobic C4-dicarboxylate transport protein